MSKNIKNVDTETTNTFVDSAFVPSMTENSLPSVKDLLISSGASNARMGIEKHQAWHHGGHARAQLKSFSVEETRSRKMYLRLEFRDLDDGSECTYNLFPGKDGKYLLKMIEGLALVNEGLFKGVEPGNELAAMTKGSFKMWTFKRGDYLSAHFTVQDYNYWLESYKKELEGKADKKVDAEVKTKAKTMKPSEYRAAQKAKAC